MSAPRRPSLDELLPPQANRAVLPLQAQARLSRVRVAQSGRHVTFLLSRDEHFENLRRGPDDARDL